MVLGASLIDLLDDHSIRCELEEGRIGGGGKASGQVHDRARFVLALIDALG
jgi:hypothetical protein